MEQVNNKDGLFPPYKPTTTIPVDSPKQEPKQMPEDEPEPKVSEEKRRDYLPGGSTDITTRENHSKTQPPRPLGVKENKSES